MNDHCPYCGSGERRPGPARGALRYVRCAACGSGYIAEPALDFRDYYDGYNLSPSLGESEVLRSRYGAMLRMLAREAPGKRLLEVGCGNGHFLSAARDLGWDVCGTELSRRQVQRARDQGLDVVCGDIAEETLFEGKSFDAVVAIEVVEHLPGPSRFFAVTARRLAPAGVLFVTTPNFGSVTRRLLGASWSVLSDEHVALASPRGLAASLEAAGFGIVLLRSKSLYVGEYVRVLRGQAERVNAPLAAENAMLRDRIETSRLLSSLKWLANAALGATGLGEALECLARLRTGSE